MSDEQQSASNSLFSHLDQTESIVATPTVDVVALSFSSLATDTPSPRD